MKDKNFPYDIKNKSLNELKELANNIIESLENKKDLESSIKEYQDTTIDEISNIITSGIQQDNEIILINDYIAKNQLLFICQFDTFKEFEEKISTNKDWILNKIKDGSKSKIRNFLVNYDRLSLEMIGIEKGLKGTLLDLQECRGYPSDVLTILANNLGTSKVLDNLQRLFCMIEPIAKKHKIEHENIGIVTGNILNFHDLFSIPVAKLVTLNSKWFKDYLR